MEFDDGTLRLLILEAFNRYNTNDKYFNITDVMFSIAYILGVEYRSISHLRYNVNRIVLQLVDEGLIREVAYGYFPLYAKSDL